MITSDVKATPPSDTTGEAARAGGATPANIAPHKPPYYAAEETDVPASTCPTYVLVLAMSAAVLQLPMSAATFDQFQPPAELGAEDLARATPTSSAADALACSPMFSADSPLGPTTPAAVTSCSLPTVAH